MLACRKEIQAGLVHVVGKIWHSINFAVYVAQITDKVKFQKTINSVTSGYILRDSTFPLLNRAEFTKIQWNFFL
jgi:hypothetical protein